MSGSCGKTGLRPRRPDYPHGPVLPLRLRRALSLCGRPAQAGEIVYCEGRERLPIPRFYVSALFHLELP